MCRNLACWIFIALLAGCSGQSVAPVSGRVTLDGQPLAGVVVYFRPTYDRTNNPGTGSIGTTDADGYYVLRQIQPQRTGAVIGPHWVTIRSAPASAEIRTSAQKELDAKLKKLGTDLPCTVPPGGKSDADFPLPLPPSP